MSGMKESFEYDNQQYVGKDITPNRQEARHPDISTVNSNRAPSGHPQSNPHHSQNKSKFSFFNKLLNGEKLSRAEKSLIKVTLIMGLGGLTLGYNIGVVSGGVEDIKERFDIDLGRQGFFVSAMPLGSVLGCLFGGIMSDLVGRWWTCQFQAMLFFAGAFIIAGARDYRILVAGRIIVGIGAAITSIASVPYLKEISPTTYKGRFQGAFEVSVSAGILLSNIFNIISLFRDISWRLLYGFPAILVFFQCILLILIPESPSFLAQKGRLTEASRALEKIYNDPDIVEAEFYGLRLENMRKVDGTFRTFIRIISTYKQPFILIIVLVILQSVSGGFVFAIYGSLIYENSSFSEAMALYYTTTLSIIRLIVTMVAVFRIDKRGWGRRSLLIRGSAITIIGYFALVLTYYYHDHPTSRYFYLLDSCIIIFGYTLSFGVVTRILQSEVFPTIIRSRTMSMTSFAQSGMQFVVLLLFLEATGGASYGAVFLVFLIFTMIGLIFSFYFIPETSGKSSDQILEEMEKMSSLLCSCVKITNRSGLTESLIIDGNSSSEGKSAPINAPYQPPVDIALNSPNQKTRGFFGKRDHPSPLMIRSVDDYIRDDEMIIS